MITQTAASILLLASLGLLLRAAWLDASTGLLPDRLTLSAAALVLVAEALQCRAEPAVLGALAGFGSLKTAQWLYHRVRNRDGLGSGDAKLMLSLGALVGPSGVFAVIGGGSLLALLVNLPRFLQAPSNRRRQMAVPFGPSLLLAGLLVKFAVPTLFPSGVNYGQPSYHHFFCVDVPVVSRVRSGR